MNFKVNQKLFSILYLYLMLDVNKSILLSNIAKKVKIIHTYPNFRISFLFLSLASFSFFVHLDILPFFDSDITLGWN